MIFPVVMPVVMVVALVVCLYFFFGRGSRPPLGQTPGPYPDNALNILKERYAKGEISKEDFDRMKQDILN
ncbi:MAG: SHOCT domain-containing protein [Deltaproteobacteria bacterium]|nr:SHOCT domain-containing protein [Deltaproteobacteria bacterium]